MQVRLYLSDPSYLSLWLLFSYLKYPSSHVRNFPKLRVRIYCLSAELYLEHSESVSIPGTVSLTSISIRGTVSWTSFLFHRLVVRLSSEQNVENFHPVWSFGLCLCGKKKSYWRQHPQHCLHIFHCIKCHQRRISFQRRHFMMFLSSRFSSEKKQYKDCRETLLHFHFHNSSVYVSFK